MWLETCGEKPLTLRVIRLIGCTLDPVPRRLHMSYGREGSQMLNILESLEVLVSFSRIERMWENLTPDTLSVVEDLADLSTSLDFETHEEKGPSSRIKLNHPPEVIMENMNELTLRKCTVDKCVANFVSYSYYLSKVKPTKVEEALQDESWVKSMHNKLL